jgi:predicted PurR-regulated permease PerM
MNTKTVQVGFYILFLLSVFVLFSAVISPYLATIFLAIVTVVLFAPIHTWFLNFFSGRKNVTAIFSTLSVLVAVFLPLSIIANLLVLESTDFYFENRGKNIGSQSLEMVVGSVAGVVESRFPGIDIDIDRFANVGTYIDQGLAWFSGNITNFFTSVLHLTLSLFLYILCLFYLFRDGDNLFKKVLAWSPLYDIHDNLILNKLSLAVTSVLRGQLMVGVIQGIMTGIGFWIFGVPHPVIWGSVAAFASLIPAIGTSFVSAPAIIYLLLTGNISQAVGLLAWAVVAVGLVDNILGPYFINRGVKIHPFLILISVLGGIGLFGPIGFIAGPVILSLLFALMDIYPIIMRTKDSTSVSGQEVVSEK